MCVSIEGKTLVRLLDSHIYHSCVCDSNYCILPEAYVVTNGSKLCFGNSHGKNKSTGSPVGTGIIPARVMLTESVKKSATTGRVPPVRCKK